MPMNVTSQILFDGALRCTMQFTCYGDGTPAEINVKKVDVASLTPPCKAVKVMNAVYDVVGGSVRLSWEGSPNKDFLIASAVSDKFDYSKVGGLANNTPGKTGNILFSTLDAGPSFAYTITLELMKKY